MHRSGFYRILAPAKANPKSGIFFGNPTSPAPAKLIAILVFGYSFAERSNYSKHFPK